MDLKNCIFEELLKAAQPKCGLFVIPLPTGSGKTYNSCLLMAEELKKEDARRIFYVTDAKKQLDATIEDIRKNLTRSGIKLQKHDILRVYSQEEQWERAFTDPAILQRMEANPLFQGDKAFANLKRLYTYNDVTEGITEEIAKNRSRLIDKVRKEALTPIRQKYKNETDEVIASHILREYSVLEELYPELLFYKSKIVALTASKLHTTASPKLVRKGTQPYWKHIEDSLVIIDESDRVKEAAMKRLFDCECGRRRRFNFWGLCYFICEHYEEVLDMQRMPEWVEHKDNIQAMLKAIKKKKEYLIDDIAPQKMLSGLELNENVNRGNFIFYDEDQTFSAENFVLSIHNKKEENVSYLQPKQMLKSQNDNTLSFAANRIILFLKIFVQIVDKHAEEYARIENELRKKKSYETSVDLESERAFDHIIKYMGINEGNTEYRQALQELRCGINFETPHSKDQEVESRSIYDKGISFIEVYSLDNDRYSCCFDYHEMRCMPENVLLDMVNHNRVIMCSTTADSQSPVHNYDFNYITKQGVKVEKIDNDTLRRIEGYIALNYANPDVKFSIYKEENTNPKEKIEVYLGKCNQAVKDCLDFVSTDKNTFDKNNSARMVNMLSHYMDFIENPDAKAWLYFQPFSYTGKSSIGIKKALNILQQARITKCGEKFDNDSMDEHAIDDGNTRRYSDIYPKLNVCFLSGEHFKRDLEEVEKLLKEDPKLKMFCFVCYQSGAVGVNYLFETDSKYRKKHCLEAPNTKDRKDTRCNFDGIIMDKPTNFIPLIEVDDYLKACISLSILGTDNQLELKEKSDFQRALLRRRHHRVVDELSEIMKGREIQIKAALKETPAFDAFCLRWAVQALGRITRSTIYNKSVHIAIGEDMAYSMVTAKKPEIQTDLLKHVLKAINENQNIIDRFEGKEEESDITFNNDEHRRDRYISELVGISFKGTDKYACQIRERLHSIREYVMKYPEFDDRNDIDPSMRMFYIQSVEAQAKNRSYSDASVHLDAIMKQGFIRQYFETNGYCTSWKGKSWVISPQVIQQVYTGYFGEQVFKAILENAACNVGSLPEKIWERADWVVNDKLYVDVKFMSDSDFNQHVNAQSWEQKIRECGGSYIVVNVPRYAGNYSFTHTIQLEGGANLPIINGLIDVETGAILDKNVQAVLEKLNIV